MPKTANPDLSLFLDILNTLETLDIPYMIIGAFAGTVYGVTRVTYDIDIVVNLNDAHIEALAEAYPPPRYYADYYLGLATVLDSPLDETYIDRRADQLGQDVAEFWHTVKIQAQGEAARQQTACHSG